MVLETRTAWVTYRVTGREVVDPGAVEVLDAAPGQPQLTLATCHPEYSARQRLVVHAVQESVVGKAPGVRPPALSEQV